MAIQTNLGATFQKYQFMDDGDVIASFRMNPADIKLSQRLQEAGAFFENLGSQMPENATFEDALKLNDSIEEKVCYVLGYDAKASLFGQLSATSLMSDGNMFVIHVVDTIKKHALPEIEKRNKAMAEAVAKHTAKYE